MKVIKIKMMSRLFFLTVIVGFFIGCNLPLDNKIGQTTIQFNADSAYYFIAKQVSFGPRIPNSEAQYECYKFLEKTLKNYGAKVIVQNDTVERFDGKKLRFYNIIAQFYPQKKRRILLFSHWDSRYYADKDVDSLKEKPILGANDGGSGTGLLLEIARLLSKNEPNIGVDIIFFDVEDQGEPLFKKVYRKESWALGSQYWVSQPHYTDYLYAIGVDMVGAKNAKFLQEDFSRFYAGYYLKRIWHFAKKWGYSDVFIDKRGKMIVHDHYFINEKLKIPAVLIIENYNDKFIFGDYWHTHKDNLGIIDKKTLKKVGQLITNIIFTEN